MSLRLLITWEWDKQVPVYQSLTRENTLVFFVKGRLAKNNNNNCKHSKMQRYETHMWHGLTLCILLLSADNNFANCLPDGMSDLI